MKTEQESGRQMWPTASPIIFADYEHGEGCIVADDFQHGRNLRMGHYCIIEAGCVVGDDVTLGNFVLLKKGTVIGDRTFVDSYVKSSGQNWIGSDVTLRFNATIAREVTVEDGAFVSPNVMTIYSTHEGEKRGGTVIGAGCHVGTNAVLGPNVKLAPGVVVGALAFVNKDLVEPGIYVGQPARLIKAGQHAATAEAKAEYIRDYKK
jgi:UDP-2-acetamido-3-amino-2,3-dideoxy-glucuronate N-acetyltransferase